MMNRDNTSPRRDGAEQVSITIVQSNDSRGMLVQCTGTIVGAEIIEANEQLYSEQNQDSLAYQLWDFTASENVDLSLEDAQILARQDSQIAKQYPNMVIAIVTQDDLLFGTCRYYEGYVTTDAIKTRVFRSRNDAESWIKANTPR